MREFTYLENAVGLKIEALEQQYNEVILLIEGNKYARIEMVDGYEGKELYEEEIKQGSMSPHWMQAIGIITQEEYDATEAEKKAKKEQAQAEADLAHNKAVEENTKIFKAVGFFPEGTPNRVKNEVLDNLGATRRIQ